VSSSWFSVTQLELPVRIVAVVLCLISLMVLYFEVEFVSKKREIDSCVK
jgi:hypothetical protein